MGPRSSEERSVNLPPWLVKAALPLIVGSATVTTGINVAAGNALAREVADLRTQIAASDADQEARLKSVESAIVEMRNVSGAMRALEVEVRNLREEYARDRERRSGNGLGR